MTKVVLVTGAGRGLGTEIARAALAAGHKVVATGRRPVDVATALDCDHQNLLFAQLDVTSREDAQATVRAALDRFGRIDVLINNAGNLFTGYFEEITPDQMRRQFETNVFGPMNVTRAVLPIMRKQRAGHIITVTSTAGLVGMEFTSAYAASKFAEEGWMESLRFDVEPFGIRTTIVEPGYFRTELLVDGSTVWPELSLADYAERTAPRIEGMKGMNGQQPGDPVKLAQALVSISQQSDPPQRFIAGSDALDAAEAKAQELMDQAEQSRELGGTRLSFDDV